MNSLKRGIEQQRAFRIDVREIKPDIRMVSAALSSETPVERFFGTEILSHEKDSVNMERAANGLPLLFAHNHEQPVGRVDNIRVEKDKVLRGDLYFSNNSQAREIWQDVSEGFLRDLSIGYRIDEYEELDNDIVKVTRFCPLEVSVVTVPADSAVGINRSNEGKKMADEKKPVNADQGDTGTRQQEKVEVGAELKLFRLEQDKERKEGQRIEVKRRQDIRSMFQRYKANCGDIFGDLEEACMNAPEITTERAKDLILDAMAEGYVPVNIAAQQDTSSSYSGVTERKTPQSNRIKAGEDQIDKFSRAAEISIAVQSNGIYSDDDWKSIRNTEFYSMKVSDLAREYLRITGRRGTGGREDIIGAALKRDTGISHGTGHFANILENVANKSMLAGFTEAPESWSDWCQTRNVPDFKAASLLNTSLFSDLDLVRESAQYEYGDMSDIKESITLATYGKLFGISRQALANDDLSALGDLPMKMGRSAARKIGDLAYSVLTTNGTMAQDSTDLFHADHSNYVTSGAAPSVATIEAGRTAMALQTDPAGKTLGIRPAYLITPEALRSTANVLVAAQYDPAGSAGTLTPNTVQGTVRAISDHRLDTANAAGWYLAAANDTVIIGFLNGQQTPYLESKDGWNMDGVEYKVRIDAASAAADFRGLYYNDGVT
ncbi:MAG: hypothetical protein GY799_13075 [Desulfobulbaceae bacterium]|nr:hypothetical protein [Desulfobulbaceae bacterium]